MSKLWRFAGRSVIIIIALAAMIAAGVAMLYLLPSDKLHNIQTSADAV